MRILITAGPTREAIDPVRFISNRSTGKMGFAVAEGAVSRGHEVKLISGPVALRSPDGAGVVFVETAEQMLSAVESNLDWCEVLIMTAAVADWRPVAVSAHKLKKNMMDGRIDLERTRDILDSIKHRKGNRIFVGFSADTENLVAEATRKLESKNLDLIVANDVSRTDSGFGSENNEVKLIGHGGFAEELPLMSKRDVAERIILWVESRNRV